MNEQFKFLREMPSSLNDACRSMESAADHIDALESVLLDARNAIASLPKETLGYANDPTGIPVSWPIQAELIWRINLALEAKKAAEISAVAEWRPRERSMRLGCCSAISPCSHQQRDPHSICETCQKAADAGADTIRDRAIREAVRLLTSIGYTVEPPPIKEPIQRS